MIISIVAAVAQNGVIGKDGNLPWPDISEDLRRFADRTRGHVVIVGRKTHESILKRNGRPLKYRTTIILSHNPDYHAEPSCLLARSLTEALEIARARGEEEVFVIGGAEVYREAIPMANRVYLTLVHAFVEGDASFPLFPTIEWKGIETEPGSDAEDHLGYTFFTYERIQRPSPVSS